MKLKNVAFILNLLFRRGTCRLELICYLQKLVSNSNDPGGSSWDGFQLKSGAPYVDNSIEIQRPKPVYSPPLQRSARVQVSARTPRDPPSKLFKGTESPASVAQLDAPSDWRPGGRGFNPRRGRQHSFVEIDHEIFSTVILSLPLIQEGQLSVSGERMCTILVNRLED